MKRALCAMFLASTLLTSCISHTEYGECIGLVDSGDPALQYKMSLWNAIVAGALIETFIVPIVWAVEYAKCPVAKVEK